MTSPRLHLALAATACVWASSAHATPLITTFAQSSVGAATDSDGPQAGGALSSSVTTTGASTRCSFTGTCTAWQLTAGNAVAAQNETAFGIFSALQADGTFFVGGSSANNSLLSRTTWQDSPTAAGPTSITLFIKPGELVLVDFNGQSLLSTVPIEARFKIELTVNGTSFFFAEAILRGGKNGHSLTENGTDLGGTAFADVDFPTSVFGYQFDPLFTTIDLGNLSPTDVVLYTMEVRVSGPGLETGAVARIGDPFDLSGSGSSIAFATPVPEPTAALMLTAAGVAALLLLRVRANRRGSRP
jgi:hypothetical protein